MVDDDDGGEDDDEDIAEFTITEEDMSEEIVNRVREIIAKFRNIAKYVKNSPKAKKIENFDAMAKSNNRDTIHIFLRTRWNSALEMLANLRLKTAVHSFVHYLKTTDGKKFSYKKLPDVT